MTVRGDLGQNAVNSLRETDTAAPSSTTLKACDLKVSHLGTSQLKSSVPKFNGTAITQKLSLAAPTIKLLIKGIAHAILTKLKIEPKMALNQPQNGHLSKADAKKQLFLKSFGDNVIQPLGISKNQNSALTSTVRHLEQAQKSGMLDQKLYSAVSSTLERSIKNNVRTEISLEDAGEPEKSIHDLLLEVPTASKTLRQELEKLAHVEKCITKFTSALEDHANISPEQAREIIRKAFETFPKANVVTVHNVTVLLQPADTKNPDVIFEGKYLASGAASKVHQGFSLRDNKQVVLKTSDNAAEEANANEKIRHIKNAHNGDKVEGIADELKLSHIETPEGPKTVATGVLYDNDATHDIKADMLAGCTKELEALMNEKETTGTIQDATKIEKFFEKYGSLLTPEEIASVKAELGH